MPLQAFPARHNDDSGGARRHSGHTSGRIISGVTAVTGPAEGSDRLARRQPPEHYAGVQAPLQIAVPAPAVTGAGRRGSASSGGPLSSEDSYEAAPPRRRSQPINTELVKLVASFAPLELAQLKAMEQKARIKKARAPAAPDMTAASTAAAAAAEPEDIAAVREERVGTEPQRELAQAHSIYAAAPAHLEQPLEPARVPMRPSTADATRAPHPPLANPAARMRSQSATRPAHLAAAPAKGAIVKRDLNILPNPVAQKQTEAIQRQAAVSAFVKRLQREQDLLRAEKERRLKAEQDALAAQLDEEAREARAAAAEVTGVAEVPSVPVRRKKPALPSSGVNTALKDMQAAAQDVPEKKPVDPKPWRQNMRRQKNPPVAGEAPIGAPREVPAKAVTGAPPPRNVSPGAAAARAKTLDPVARTQLKEYMERKAKDMAAKQLQERAAQQEAKTAQIKVMKAEMARARERAQRYAEVTKENPPDFKGPRPAWVDILPPEAGSAAAAQASRPLQRPRGAPAPDYEFVSERAVPYHMSDAMRMEAGGRQRQERLFGSASPTRSRGGRPVLVDNYGESLDDEDWDSGPQVVRVHDPEMPDPVGRGYRSSSARPSRSHVHPTPALAQAAVKQIQVGHPITAETLRTIELDARLAARKKYEQHQRDLQAAERRDSSRGRDTSRNRDNSRGRRRSPTTGRKHEAASLNSRSRSPRKRAKQQMRRSRSASRAGSANRRAPAAETQPAAAGSRGAGLTMPREQPTAMQAELQQARNERHVENLWDLALQLSARLGALQQHGLAAAPRQPVQAWADPQAQLEQQHLQQQQQAASLRSSMAGQLLPYPPPVAVVPTGLPSSLGLRYQELAGQRQVQQYDEAVEADIEFRTEASWPTPGHKKPRTTGSSMGAGADGSAAVAARGFNAVRSGAPTSLLSGGSSMGDRSYSDPDGVSISDADAVVFEDNSSALTSGLHAMSVAVGPGLLGANMFSGPSQSSLSACSRDQDRPSLLVRSSPTSPARTARGLNEGGRSGRPASAAPGQSRASISSSPSKQVPAAPIIQIPLPLTTSNVVADSLAPSVAGLPYDNATFSAESADEDGSSSGGESTYGQRVLTIAELHGVLEENPRLAQRLSLDREQDRWKEALEAPTPSHNSGIRIHPELGSGNSGRQEWAPPIMSHGRTSEDSSDTSGPGTPTRPCDVIVNAYEHANSPLRLRPAQRELLKVAMRTEERAEAFNSGSDMSGTEDNSEDTVPLQLPKSGDPMSIISLLVHKGRLPSRPTIIQLSEPPLLGGFSPDLPEEKPKIARGPASSEPAASVSTRRTSEVLLIPGPKGPQLVLSRELLHLQQRPQSPQQQPAPSVFPSPRKVTRETGVGEGRVNRAEPNGTSWQQLTDSLPPFVVVSAAVSTTTTAASAAPVLQQNVNTTVLHTGRAPPSPSASSPVMPAGMMQQQVGLMRSLHQQQLEERGLLEPSVRSEQRRPSAPGAAPTAAQGPDDGGSGLLGAMASPPPRPRVVTFLDEAQGPPERVRLAPGELFNQMQNTLKTYAELDAAELELQQLQNARAIAAVQREAHRIAQRLDQTTAAEAQLQLIAHTQAEMDAKLHTFEATIRDEVRKDSLGHLHDVTSLFVEQLSRNKIVHMHSTAQTTPQPPSPPKSDFIVQVGPSLAQHPVSILRNGSPQQQQSRSPSPPHLHQTSRRSISPSQGTQHSLPRPPEALASRDGSPGPGGRTSAVSFQRPSSTTSNRTAEYSEDFEEELRQSSYFSGRSASRVSFHQASHRSVPKSVSEAVDEASAGDSDSGSEVEEELASQRVSPQASLRTNTSIPESVLDYRERQHSRASNRQTSFASVAESIPSERPTSKSALRQQTSTLSVPGSVIEEHLSAPSRQPVRSALRQPSTVSIAESVGIDRSAATSSHGGRRSSGGGTESVAHTSIVGGETQDYSSVQESLPARHSGRASTMISGASRRRRSAIEEDIPSDPTYSTAFEKDEEDRISEEDFGRSRSETRTTRIDDDDSYSTDEVDSEEKSYSRRSSQRRRTAATVSSHSAEVEELIRTVNGSGSRSYSRGDDVGEDSGLIASGGSPHLQSRPSGQAAAESSTAPGPRDASHRNVAGVMTTPPSARTVPRHGETMPPGGLPLSLRASLDGGLELDDDVMASYAADAERRMRQEVALLQDRQQDINLRATTKMDQLESELAAEAQPQKRQALIRAQRLLQVQHDADVDDIQRQIHAIKADYSRQRLMLERLYRLAQLTSPAGARATNRAGAAPPGEGYRAEHGRTGAALVPRPPVRAAHASSSRSIEDDVPSEQLPSRSGSVAAGARHGSGHSTTSSIVEEPSRHARRPSSSNSVGKNIQKGSVTTDVAEEYSDQFEPSIKQSRSQLFPPGGRPPRPQSQQSSVVDDVEESLSGRRLGTSGTQSQSVVTEDNFKRSGSSAAARSQHPASGSVVTESPYSDDLDASGATKTATRTHAPQRRGSSTARSDDMDSELSVLSLKLEREKAELARQLQERRRAKIVAKQAEVEQMRKKLAALEVKSEAPARVAPARRKPPVVSDGGSESEIEDKVSDDTRAGADVSGSKAPSTVAEVESDGDAQSVEESGIADESAIDEEDDVQSAQRSSPRNRSGATVSASADERATSSSTVSRVPIDPALAAAEKDIAALKEEIERAKKEKLAEAERQKRKLQAELDALRFGQPVSRASDDPTARRVVAPPAPTPSSYGTSADSASYSQDFSSSGTVSVPSARGARSSSTVINEISQSTLQRTAGREASGSRSMSVSEERIGSVRQSSRGLGSHSGSVLEDETQRSGPHISRSSSGGAARAAGHSGNSGEVYDESFETDSVRGSIPHESSGIQDEIGPSDIPSSSNPTGASLEPIREEEVRSTSGQSISYAADSDIGHSVRESCVDPDSDAAFGGFPAAVGDTRSIGESGCAVDDTTDGIQPTATRSIQDIIQHFSVASGQSSASQSVEDEQDFPGAYGASASASGSVETDVPTSQSGSRDKDSKDSQPVLSEEFLTTADINTPSVTPSIHSAELEGAAKTSSVPATGGTRSVASQEAIMPVAEFLTSADTIGESVTPSIRSSDLAVVKESSMREETAGEGSMLQDLEEEELLVVTQKSSAGSSSSSESVSEERGDAGQPSSRSAEALDDSLPADEASDRDSQSVVEVEEGADDTELEAEYSEFAGATADIEVEEADEELSDSRGGAGLGQTSSVSEEGAYGLGDSARDATGRLESVPDVALAATEGLETGTMESADHVDDSLLERSAEGVSDGVAQPSTVTNSTGFVSDAPMQRSAAAASTTASALPEESQDDDYEPDFQPSILHAEESSRQVLEATGALASASRLVSSGDVVQEEEEPEVEEPEEEDYELDWQPSVLTGVDVDSSSRDLIQPAGNSESASRLVSIVDIVQEAEEDGDDGDEYEADFQPSAVEVPAEESARTVLEPPPAAGSRHTSTEEIVQDASELRVQASLRDVTSTSSLGSRRQLPTSQTSAKSLPSALQQQASSVSASTYEADFEAGEASESQLHGHVGLGLTTLSVVEEEGETKADATGSKVYSEAFASASVVKSHEEPTPVAQMSLPAVRSATESAASEVQDVEDDYEDMGVEEDEDEQQISAGSTGLVGPVLPPAVTNPVALEVSQRYGPASEQSGSYSEDFVDQPGQDTLASIVDEAAGAAAADPTSSYTMGRDATKGLQPLMSELRAESSLHKLASQSAERRVSAASVTAAPHDPPPAVTAEASASRQVPAQDKEETTSVLSVEEEDATSATVSSEPSAQELPLELQAGPLVPDQARPASGLAMGAADLDGDNDDYTRDFTDLHSNVEAQGSSNTVVQEPEKDRSLVSHPISQLPSPPTHSNGSASSRAAAANDGKESDESEEVPDEDLPEEDLDLSDLGLDTPLAAVLAGKEAAEPSEAEAEPSVSAGSVLARSGLAEEASTSTAVEMDAEESGMIGRGIRVTRKIESRTWRSQQALLEDEEGGLSGDVDLMDMSMPGGEGSGLLDTLGADFIIEASEANTPSHSFRVRSGDLTSAPSSGSPYGIRSALSVRLATLRESLAHEGEDPATDSETVSPSARTLRLSGDNRRSGQAGDATASSLGNTAEEAEEVADEVVAPQLSGSERSFLQPSSSPRAAQPPEPAPERTDAESAFTVAEPLPEPFSATEAAAAMTAAQEQPAREASGGASTRYSDDGLEAPPSEGTVGRQSVVEYDYYTSAALAEDDSDDLKQMAAAFESQALGADDDDEDAGVAPEYSGVSASGLSDDLTKYKVTVHSDTDEEEADGSQAAPAAVVAATAGAGAAPSPPLATEPSKEAESAPSVEASEVADEEPEAAASDPFSMDESDDRLPALQPAAAVQPPAPLVASAQAAAAVQRADEPRSEPTATDASAGPVLEPRLAAPSPTASPPRSEPSSRRALLDETSLGPLPRSGLAGDDDDDGQDFKYSAVYQPHGEDSSKPGSPVPPGSEPAAEPPFSEEATAAATGEDASGGKGGCLRELAAFVGSDDEEEGGLSRSLGGRGLSAASLKPVFQALLDQPEAGGDLPKGEFESEIEEMLAASRSRSRLVSPYQSRDWAIDADTQEQEGTPTSSARASQAGIQPAVLAVPSAAAVAVAAATSSVAIDAASRDAQEEPATLATASEPRRDVHVVVDEITESTVKELVADAVEVMVGATGEGVSPFQTASIAAASATQSSRQLPALSTEDEDDGAPAVGQAADDSRVSMGGEDSISMSVDELEGDIELDADVGLDSGAALDLPSPIPSDSGSLGSPTRSYGPGAPKPSDACGATPALGPEPSDRDLAALSGGIAEEALVDSGIGLNSDEDLGWGGAELEEDWQPDVSGLIAPEMDQAAIEREHAPAVATGPVAVEEYASQVLEQFMDNRPEFLVPGAEPLSLEGFLDQERRLVHASEAQHIHNKMVYDAINEALLAIYRAANRVESQPWLRRNRIVKPLPSPAEMAQQVQQQLRAWAAMRMRDPAETDKVLAMDAQEDERARADLGLEEAEVQREVADMVWAELIEDTARQLSDLEQLLAPALIARGGVPASGRRRLDALAA